MMIRWNAQLEHDIDDVDHMTAWERTTLSLVRRQALRQARGKRTSDAIRRRTEHALDESDSADDDVVG